MACGNSSFLASPSGIFRLLTVVAGIPAIVLAWIAYFKSSWTDVFPEILAILAVEKSGYFDSSAFLHLQDDANDETSRSTTGNGGSGSSSTTRPETSEEDIDIISDKEEEYLDEILLQTLLYEKFFIGVVSVVFIMSAAYLILRVVSKHSPDSPYEIMFDFIFHVLCALGLLTGSGLVLMSAAKIQNFVDQVHDRDGFAPQEVVDIIEKHRDSVQDKFDKIAAAVIAMLNGIFYALCVVTIRMTHRIKCKSRKKENQTWQYSSKKKNGLAPQENYNDMPVYSIENQQRNLSDPAFGSYAFFRSNNAGFVYEYE